MSMRVPSFSVLFLTLAIVCPMQPSRGEGAPETATLTLDGLSFISFQDMETFAIPSGSTVVLRFGTTASDGSRPVTIDPTGVSIAPISLSNGGTLRYSLSSPAAGSLRSTSTGAVLQFSATVSATLDGPQGGGTFQYPMNFTTESASASNQAQSATVTVDGARIDLAARYVQLVAATTNKTQAYPEPGKAVYTVLSGTLDYLPALQ